eukprot:CAMPEP_0175124212 /NCGR_PEP_ID=MMETSP0087-20121206/2659_1 /TAXON_ID=136419 /ORGANISM="Unknown Unknown, Strain D1" /LENGTH=69 /DNA_ID=CAMNT_0016405961 /DNA_START=18 /DNA_END=227 /DNA_ORIENTATION=-
MAAGSTIDTTAPAAKAVRSRNLQQRLSDLKPYAYVRWKLPQLHANQLVLPAQAKNTGYKKNTTTDLARQ